MPQGEDPGHGRVETKPLLARALALQAAGWQLEPAPLLADCAYGDSSDFRAGLAQEGLGYPVAVSPSLGVFAPETRFAVPAGSGRGSPPSVPRPERKPESVRALALRLPSEAWQRLVCRTSLAGAQLESRFACVRISAAHPPGRFLLCR